ncbi:MAG TPA: LysE family transporter [Verrucomicrobiales bacterium]|nr:LysE family transporter [Verrucomicrobiales bacterium]
MDYLAFAVIMLLAQFSPGPDMLLLLKNAVNHPLRAGLLTVSGIVVGLCVHTTLALTGIALVFHNSPAAARVLGIAGGLYLAWLAFQLFRSVFTARPPEVHAARKAGVETPLSDKAAFLQGLITNLLNLKAVLFILSVLVYDIGKDNSLSRKLVYGMIIVVQALVFWSLFVRLLKRPAVRSRYLSWERPLNFLFGLGLVACAVTALVVSFRSHGAI